MAGGGDSSEGEGDEEDYTPDMDMMLMNSDFRNAITNAIYNLGEADTGKLTIEQFLIVLRHLHSATASQGNNNVGLVPLLIAR